MDYEIHIRKNDTGEVHIYRSSIADEYADGLEFNWTENNFSCDCNRALAWLWAVGEDEEGEGQPCGHTAYDIVSAPWM